MEIIYRALSDIKKAPNNPRSITRESLEKLKKSIKDNPDYFEARPIILSNRTGELVIIAGNQRYEACLQLGLISVPTILLPGLTEDREREIMIRDNVNNGEWDENILKEWDSCLLSDWGVELPEWNEPNESEDIEEDGFSEEDASNADTRVKSGDIWQLGDHRLMCGDSTNELLVKELLSGDKVDLYITDPPYNVAYEGKTKDALTIQNDEINDDSFRDFLVKAFMAADSVLKEGSSFYIWHADSEGYNFRYAVKHCGWLMKQCLIWNKNSMVMGRQDYQWKHEPCLYGWKSGASHHWYSDRKQTTILEFNRPNRNADHPTMEPIELFAYQIKNSSQKGDIVLDSFGGSGTTIIACEQLSRKARLMELDPRYCDVILARWEHFTGKKAKKISGE